MLMRFNLKKEENLINREDGRSVCGICFCCAGCRGREMGKILILRYLCGSIGECRQAFLTK